MQMIFPKLLGGMAAMWSVRALIWPDSRHTWPAMGVTATVLFAAAALILWTGRHDAAGATALAAACVITLMSIPRASLSPVVLMLWASLIVLATDGHPRERALLLRVCVTCVYGFTALVKTNPSFLGGEQIYRITMTRSQFEWAADMMRGWMGVALAVAVLASEYWLAIGLWFARTRAFTATLGVVLHIALIPGAATNWGSGVLFLVVLNFGLVAMYPAFWQPLRPDPIEPEPASESESPEADADVGLGGHERRDREPVLAGSVGERVRPDAG